MYKKIPSRKPTILWSVLSLIFLSFLGGLFLPQTTPASDNKDMTGKELAQKVHDRYVGDNSAAKMEMILIDADGDRRVREMAAMTLDKDQVRKSLIRFLAPPDIAGTGFLSIEHRDEDTEQFLYLPALKRIRRIVASQKGRSFVNSDFTYEDMERRPVEDAKHTVVGQETYKGHDCWILESRPLPQADSKYSLIKSWVPEGIFLPLKTHFFDAQGTYYKSYKVEELKKIEDIWTATDMLMHNLQDDHKTILRVDEIDYNTNIDDSAMSKRQLENW